MSTEKHPLRGLLVAQFLGAFNDNAWKFVVTFLGLGAVAATSSKDVAEAAYQARTTTAFVIFTIPLMIFSIPAAHFADRFSKRAIILWMKSLELVLMLSGTLLLYVSPGADQLSLVILALMGVQSAIFSPAKYGILPEVLPHHKLSAGNGALELWTFLAIIAGTGVAGALFDKSGDQVWLCGLALCGLSVVGLVAALRIPPVDAASPESSEGMLGAITGAWKAIRAERILFLTVAGLTLYWGVATLLGQNLLVYAKSVLGSTNEWAGYILAASGIGVGLGAFLAGRLSRSKVEYGLIPFGATLLCLSLIVLGFIAPTVIEDETLRDGKYWQVFVAVIPLGISSGFVIVPLSALLQWKAPANRRGAIIALANAIIFAGILLGSFLAHGLSTAEFSSRGIFFWTAAITAAGMIWALYLLPTAFVRFVLCLLTNTIYRMKVVGRRHVPEEGGVLLVPNHVSFVDGLFLIASVDRPVRFLVEAAYFHHPLAKPFMKSLGAIPISSSAIGFGSFRSEVKSPATDRQPTWQLAQGNYLG
ncbi:MAG: MFS transporter, partial [Planctomycetota bacterium]